MKKNHLLVGVGLLLAGIALIFVGLLTENRLSDMIFALGVAYMIPSFIRIGQYFYWSSPKHKAEYEERMTRENIEMHDELKVMLRDRSGRYAYVFGLVVICVSIVIFAVLGKLDIIADARAIVLYLWGYLMFQIVIGKVLYHKLLQKY